MMSSLKEHSFLRVDHGSSSLYVITPANINLYAYVLHRGRFCQIDRTGYVQTIKTLADQAQSLIKSFTEDPEKLVERFTFSFPSPCCVSLPRREIHLYSTVKSVSHEDFLKKIQAESSPLYLLPVDLVHLSHHAGLEEEWRELGPKLDSSLGWNDLLRQTIDRNLTSFKDHLNSNKCLGDHKSLGGQRHPRQGFCLFFYLFCLGLIPQFNAIDPRRMISIKGGASIVYWLMVIGFEGELDGITADIDLTPVLDPETIDFSDYEAYEKRCAEVIEEFLKFLKENARGFSISPHWRRTRIGLQNWKLFVSKGTEKFSMDLVITDYRPAAETTSLFNQGVKRWFGSYKNYSRFMITHGLWCSPIEVEYCSTTFLEGNAYNPVKRARYSKKLELIRQFLDVEPCPDSP
jgi:hypothetical protein